MLQTQSVYPATLALLKELMSLEMLSNFNLVGGTALALQFGHRISVDLDLFSYSEFNRINLQQNLERFAEEKGFDYEWEIIEKMTLIGKINNIKVDFIYYPYKLIDELIISDNIRLLSPKDIVAMKLSAIAQRGSKKDFFDLFELLNLFSLEEILGFYMKKFPNTDTTFLIRSLLYFRDADKQDKLTILKPYKWDDVKARINDVVNKFIDDQI